MKKTAFMMYKILLLDEAKTDITEARLYYNSLLDGLGKRFKLDLKKMVSRVQNNPHSFGFRFEQFRTANLEIFPYQIHYRIEEENKTIIIFAILHGYRNPPFIKGRNS
jgi:plasmid stabilization system protein ParE